MIFDAVSFKDLLRGTHLKDRALEALANRLEERLGVRIVRDARTIPYGRPELAEPFRRAQLLREIGAIKEFGQVYRVADEPPTKAWYAICNVGNSHQTGGTTWDSDVNAFHATIAEALERYIWMTQDDYFVEPVIATCDEIAKRGPFIAPEAITAYTDDQRKRSPRRTLRPEAAYLWVKGTSLIDRRKIFIPAQIVSGKNRNDFQAPDEPIIRQQNTNGLATWTTQSGAQLAGLLEVIERDAYMILWMNQLTLPRIALEPLCAAHPTLKKAVATCERYRFKVHAIQMLTDAPTHAVMVMLEDMSGNSPRFSFGIRSHRSLSAAIEKAMCEATRGLRSYRMWQKEGNVWDVNTPTEEIGHRERLHYWGVPENAAYLEFLLHGPEMTVEEKPWDKDSIEQHLSRTLQWCRSKHYEVISVPLTHSAKNPTELHIEMVIAPDMVPTFLHEGSQQFGGDRWRDVPLALGYTPRERPFGERPHPFS